MNALVGWTHPNSGVVVNLNHSKRGQASRLNDAAVSTSIISSSRSDRQSDTYLNSATVISSPEAREPGENLDEIERQLVEAQLVALMSVQSDVPLATRLRDAVAKGWTMWPYNLIIYPLVAPLAEVLYFFECRRYRREHATSRHTSYAASDAFESLRFWHTLLADPDPAAAEVMLSSWFGGHWPPRRDAVRFIGWSLYNSLELEAGERETAELIAARVEAAVGRPFAPPRGDWMPCMLFTTEELSPSPIHLPLFAYLLLQSAHRVVDGLLRCLSFELCRIEGGASLSGPGGVDGGRDDASGDEVGAGDSTRPRLAATGAAQLSYWYRPATEGADAAGAAFDRSTPVVFLHGARVQRRSVGKHHVRKAG